MDCAFPGCGAKDALARGWCSGHYSQWWRKGTVGVLSHRRRPIVASPELPGSMLVPLTQGYFAIIDEGDADDVGRHSWQVAKSKELRYAKMAVIHQYELLHRYLWMRWCLPPTEQIDHINWNGLDCRRANLRAATRAQNQWHKRMDKRNTSGVRGAIWTPRYQAWTVTIQANGRGVFVGRFKNIEDAAVASEAACKRLHGDFAGQVAVGATRGMRR